ncbi:hypothetical protein LTR05_002489 [Lithohypha guttulata]|uniref:Zn(2)-C6 fungal-type domain-containing protein n=1 Tax=Lithohypha guttulata TaxID=1690604 RepID=A0AAN7T4Q4_9EURO|nr:hypothetical protein LTR05_002489 [Lithohypha guttulata]
MPLPPVKKACDACHRRKVRCSGGLPCKNCGSANLQCTYLAIPQKKGPKGSRAKVISEIRDTQIPKSISETPTPPSPIQSSTSAPALAPTPTAYSHEAEDNPFDFNTPPMSPADNVRNLDLLSTPTVESCISFFFNHLYPTMPIFSRQYLSRLVAEYRHGPPEVYCLALSLCSFILVQPGMSFEGMPMPASYEENPAASRYRLANLLLREVHRMRKGIDYIDNPTLLSVQASFFMFASYFGLEKANAAWYHLREATTLAHMLGMNEEATYKVGDPEENKRNRRFYWLVLVTERAFCLHRHKPLSMLATIELPIVDVNSPDAPILHGFLYLASLFRLIDDEFMVLWNKAKTECTPSYLSRLQNQLVDALPRVLLCTENQAADVKITQHWLRCMVWQLSISNGYLSSSSSDLAMSFRYPIEIAKDLIQDVNSMNIEAMEVHGVGLIEKLFDMSCTLSDVIAYVPIEQTINEAQQPQNCLNHLLNLISRLRGGASRYVPMLMAKVSENLHHLSNPLAHLPQTLDAFMQDSPSTQSSPQDTDNRSRLKAPPQHIQIPSPAQSTSLSGRPTSHTDGVSTPQSQQNQERLMFETYSPSIANHNDATMTPPIYGMPETPQSQFAPSFAINQHALPRSVPPNTKSVDREVIWHGYCA